MAVMKRTITRHLLTGNVAIQATQQTRSEEDLTVVTVLTITDVDNDESYIVPLDEAARLEVVRQLNGGGGLNLVGG